MAYGDCFIYVFYYFLYNVLWSFKAVNELCVCVPYSSVMMLVVISHALELNDQHSQTVEPHVVFFFSFFFICV